MGGPASPHCLPGGSYDDEDTYRRLAHALAALPDTDGKVPFYLSTPPEAFLPIVDGLIDSGLADQGPTRSRRLLVEKPYGHDRASAASLDDAVRRGFAEQQVFRIDHYLGKDTVQNLLALRQPAARPSLGVRHSAASTRSAPA